ncbi:hypothetical protein [Vallitalea guaymasensis]|uniref:hypothetical protein n=1 Tax=Vallitalea guaymasensis TaxID=1185412 RepID=UPI000DE28DAE|nr:hypothetical protein [Vallitalea guaymasensis]
MEEISDLTLNDVHSLTGQSDLLEQINTTLIDIADTLKSLNLHFVKVMDFFTVVFLIVVMVLVVLLIVNSCSRR